MTALADIPPPELATYVRTARRRAEARRRLLEARYERAWEVARRGAQLLKEQFGATRVVLFGSLLHPRRLHEHSDIDLAEWGIDEHEYLKAAAALLDLDPEFEVDLVEAEFARPEMVESIEKEGVEL